MDSACAVQPRILIADDQPDLIDALKLLLKAEGIHMQAVTSPDAALAALRAEAFDLLLMDLNYTGDTTSGREGIDLLSRIQALDSTLPVIVMTGWGSVDLAVEAMRRGVRDFVQKPWDNSQLVATLRSEIEQGRERRQRLHHERREMEEARRIQRQLLPTALPQLEGWELAFSWQPASGVGGDCFDAIMLTPTRIALSIADVVGKGIPAALLMSNLQAAVRAFATATTEPRELCHQVNRILCGHIAEGRFISFCYCIIDTEIGTLSVLQCRPLSPDRRPCRRQRRSTHGRRRSARRISRFVLRARQHDPGRWRPARALHGRHHRSSDEGSRDRRGIRRRTARGSQRDPPGLRRPGAGGQTEGRRHLVYRRSIPGRRHTYCR